MLLPQSAMVQALQSGNVRAIWQDVVWKVQTSTQEDDGTLTLTAEREKVYEVPKERPVEVDGEPVLIGDDTPVSAGRRETTGGYQVYTAYQRAEQRRSMTNGVQQCLLRLCASFARGGVSKMDREMPLRITWTLGAPYSIQTLLTGR